MTSQLIEHLAYLGVARALFVGGWALRFPRKGGVWRTAYWPTMAPSAGGSRSRCAASPS